MGAHWKSASQAIWSGLNRAHGLVSSIAGIGLGLIAWKVAPEFSVPLWLVCLVTVFFVVLILALLFATLELSKNSARLVASPALAVRSAQIEGKAKPIILFQPSAAFGVNSVVSFFRLDDDVEQLVGLGYVQSIQDNGQMQAVLSQDVPGAQDVIRALLENRQDAIKSIRVKHFVTNQHASFPVTRTNGLSGGTAQAEQQAASGPVADATDASTSTAKTDTSSHWFERLRAKDFAQARVLFAKDQEESKDSLDQKKRRESIFYAMAVSHGDPNALQHLEELRNDEHARSNAHYFLAQHFRTSGKFERALSEVQNAAKTYNHTEWPDRAAIISLRAEIERAAGRVGDAERDLLSGLRASSDDAAKETLLKALAAHYKDMGQSELRAIALLSAREVGPEDSSAAFDSAYAWSGLGHTKLAAYLYDLLLQTDTDNSTAMNNLGVAFNSLDCPIRAVDWYQRSAQQKETLAMANIASKYLDAGFVSDATRVLDEAQSASDEPHENVAHTLSRISTRRDAEEENIKEILEFGKRQHLFLVEFGKAYWLSTDTVSLDGTWVDNDGVLYSVTLPGDIVEIRYKEYSSDRRVRGSLVSRAAPVVLEDEEYSLPGPQKTWKKKGTGLLYVDKDLGGIFLQLTQDKAISLLSLRRAEERDLESRPARVSILGTLQD